MSAIYNLEPQPTASAIMHTTRGELAVELFAKQTPLACRNFLQLALDGYYDNTPFHRLVPGFIIQGGDPTGTGHGGESIYDGGAFGATDLDPWPADQRRGANAGDLGVGFRDEFHSRLKFTRRGLLAMANDGRPDTNGSQFFFTLGKTDELNGKNTLFGRIAAGDTIYNLAKMGDAEVEEGGERPLYPIKIVRIEILVNPFADMQKRDRIAKRQVEPVLPAAAKKKGSKRKGKQLLSFEDDEGDGDDAPAVKKPKFATQAAGAADEDERASSQKEKSKKNTKVEKGSKDAAKQQPPRRQRDGSRDEEERMQLSPDPEKLPTRRKSPDRKTSSRPPIPAAKIESSPEPEQLRKKKKMTALERTNEEIAALTASMRRNVRVGAAKETKKEKKSALEELIPEESIRGRKRRPGGDAPVSARDEREALSFLQSFRSKLAAAPAEKPKETAPENGESGENKTAAAAAAAAAAVADGEAGKEDDDKDDDAVCDLHFIANCQSCRAWDKPDARDGDEDEDDNDRGWMSHALSCAADKLGKDLSYRKKAEEELVVIDPLLAPGRGGPREEGKRGNERRRGNGRDWDRDRDRDSRAGGGGRGGPLARERGGAHHEGGGRRAEGGREGERDGAQGRKRGGGRR